MSFYTTRNVSFVSSLPRGQRCEAFWVAFWQIVFVLCGTGFASVVSLDGVADHWQSQCHTHQVCGKMLHSVPPWV
jgi:hypothetical protein